MDNLCPVRGCGLPNGHAEPHRHFPLAAKQSTGPQFEDYMESFAMPCSWPVGLKEGDGSPAYCEAWARYRVIFPDGHRKMLCTEHQRVLAGIPALAQAAPAPVASPVASEGSERPPGGHRPVEAPAAPALAGVRDCLLISNPPRTNGHTEEAYKAITARYTAACAPGATPGEAAYAEAFDATAAMLQARKGEALDTRAAEWEQLWGPVMDEVQKHGRKLGIPLGSSISEWVLALVKERIARASTSKPSLDALRALPYTDHSHSPESIQVKLRDWANRIYARYGHPVYLVGSSLNGGGRDVDVRVVIPYFEFYARWPDGHDSPAWAAEMAKQGRQGVPYVRANLDFQVQNDVEAIGFEDKPRLRLDTVEEPRQELAGDPLAAVNRLEARFLEDLPHDDYLPKEIRVDIATVREALSRGKAAGGAT